MRSRILLSAMLATAALFAQAPTNNTPLFQGDEVHDLWIYLPQPNWFATLDRWHQADSDEMLEGELWWNGTQLKGIGVRFKGNSSYNHPNGKKPFRIDFDEFNSANRIGDTTTISLNNIWNDPTFVREDSFYRTAIAAGLMAPRTNYVALYVNNEYYGLYFMTERVNRSFVRARLGSAETGNLWEGELGADMRWRGEAQAVYEPLYTLKTNETANDYSALIRLLRVLNETPNASFREEIEKVLDVRNALSYLAVNNYTVNIDSYVGLAHNYYLYQRRSDGRIMFIPWDGNLSYGALGFGQTIDGMKRLALDWSQQPAQRPLNTRLLAIPEYRTIYNNIMRDLSTRLAHPEDVAGRMNLMNRFIRPWVLQDKKKMFTDADYDRAMQEDIQAGMIGGARPPGNQPQPVPPPQNPPPQVPPGGAGPGLNMIPGLEPFVRARTTEVLRLLQP
jgi:spore coat protein CotH